MRTIKLLLSLLVLVQSSGQAQDLRTRETRVADVLTQMPASDLKSRDRLLREMISMGQEGIWAFTDQLVAPGTGDDTRVRFALGNLAHYAAKPGLDKDRTLISLAFCEALKKAANAEVKAFLLEQLKFLAGEEAAPFIQPYLSDTRLGEPAVQALLGSRSAAAVQALKAALPSLTGKNRAAVVKALGELRAASASREIEALMNSGDPDLQRAVLYALAEIAMPSAEKTLLAAAKKVGYAYERSAAAAALERYAGRLGEDEQLSAVRKICRTLLKECRKPQQRSYAISALNILVNTFGYEALPDLLAAVDAPEKDVRGAALRYAAQITDLAATRKWLEKLPRAKPEVQAEIIQMLGRRGDRLAVPAIKNSCRSPQSEVRAAAYEALSMLTGKAALPELLAAVKKAGPEELPALRKALESLVGQAEVAQVMPVLAEVSGPSKGMLLEIAGARGATVYYDDFLRYTGDQAPEVRQAAYRSLKFVASADSIKSLIDLMPQASTPAEVQAVQEGLLAACRQAGQQDKAVKEVLTAAAAAAPNRERFYGVLGRIGGAEALKTVNEGFSRGSGETRQAAFRAMVDWTDHSAAPYLYAICTQGAAEFQAPAFDGYVRQIRRSSVSADQKLLLLRKIMPQSRTAAQKRRVIEALADNRTLLTLVFIGSYLDDPSIRQEAAMAAMSIALPPPGTKEGLYGNVVRAILEKTVQVISGAESEYNKENIRAWLKSMPAGAGFVPIFNGKDLSGWKGLVDNPLLRAKMSAAELAEKQAQADRKLLENWRVKDGMIVFNGKGDNLCTTEDYGDFEMLVDWRITANGDSGIYLRGSPQVQIWDPARKDVGAQVGSGGLYNNQKNPSRPLKFADNPVGEWNTFRITMIGDRVTVYLNGELVVDNVVMENYWDRSMPIFPTGQIELQAHGTDLAFRDIYMQKITGGEYTLSVEEKADGFQALFNGKNLDGWVGNKVDYRAEDGMIVIQPQGKGSGNLFTEKEYKDFIFRFEFQLTPGANNGLGIRAPLEGDAAYMGMELQILDDTAPIYAKLQPYQYHGSVYGVIPANRGFLAPVGEWNREEVTVRGTQVKVVLNGTEIVNGDIEEASRGGTMDHREHPGLKRQTGHIGFLGHGSVVRFRNIRIKSLN